VVEVLHAPHPEGLSLLLVVGGEHFLRQGHATSANRKWTLYSRTSHRATLPIVASAIQYICIPSMIRKPCLPSAGARTEQCAEALPSTPR
jgi:hypothetical protein